MCYEGCSKEGSELHLVTRVIVEGVWAEDLFQWFYDSIMRDGGDGAGVIVSGDKEETARLFIEWWQQKVRPKFPHAKDMEFWHPRSECRDTINYHDSNENFIFSEEEIQLHGGDYMFVVAKDCPFGEARLDEHKRIKACQSS